MKTIPKAVLQIPQSNKDPMIDLVIDTLKRGKQALVFSNSKRNAESAAEKISDELRKKGVAEQCELSEYLLHSLSRPTKQCERLARCARYSVVFHHAGLTSDQRLRIEDDFRKGIIRIICCTPTLAAGMDLPAFRTVITSLKRFGHRGMDWIPVLEYEQISGRAGRPKFDSHGESIVIASETEKNDIIEMYINGEVENITSKLAVEPVLRTYLLSLIASGYVSTKKEIMGFFEKTFWAYEFKDMERLEFIIDKMLSLLEKLGFIKTDKPASRHGFTSALESGYDLRTKATDTGKRVAELYIDPLTAHFIIECLKKAVEMEHDSKPTAFSFLQMASHTLEIRPLIRVKTKEFDMISDYAAKRQEELLEKEPNVYDYEFDDFLDSIKTAIFFEEWVNEKEEEYLLETFSIRPGEIKVKIDIADWLLYCASELSELLGYKRIKNEIYKLRTRLDYGVKEELLTLVRLQGIGRVRARKLFNNGIKDLGDMRKTDIATLKQIVGEKTAQSIKEQLNQAVSPVKENKRKGQISIVDFDRLE